MEILGWKKYLAALVKRSGDLDTTGPVIRKLDRAGIGSVFGMEATPRPLDRISEKKGEYFFRHGPAYVGKPGRAEMPIPDKRALDAILSRKNQVLIIAEPGGGKTMLLAGKAKALCDDEGRNDFSRHR